MPACGVANQTNYERRILAAATARARRDQPDQRHRLPGTTESLDKAIGSNDILEDRTMTDTTRSIAARQRIWRSPIVLIVATALAGCGSATDNSSPSQQQILPQVSQNMTPSPLQSPTTTTPAITKHGLIVSEVQDSVKLSVLDPKSGRKTPFREFPYSSATTSTSFTGYAVQDRGSFSPDFNRMTLTTTAADGSTHVGWQGEDGIFVDVSKALGLNAGFSSTTNHTSPSFDQNGNFYFVENSGKGTATEMPKMVAAGSMTPVRDVPELSHFAVQTVFRSPTGMIFAVNENASFAHVTRPDGNGGYDVDQILNDDQYLTTKTGNLQYGLARCNFGPPNPKASCENLLPQTDRIVTNAVVNPDGTQVAFVSLAAGLTAGLSGNRDLFTVESNGGTPNQIGEGLMGTQAALIPNTIIAWI